MNSHHILESGITTLATGDATNAEAIFHTGVIDTQLYALDTVLALEKSYTRCTHIFQSIDSHISNDLPSYTQELNQALHALRISYDKLFQHSPDAVHILQQLRQLHAEKHHLTNKITAQQWVAQLDSACDALAQCQTSETWAEVPSQVQLLQAAAQQLVQAFTPGSPGIDLVHTRAQSAVSQVHQAALTAVVPADIDNASSAILALHATLLPEQPMPWPAISQQLTGCSIAQMLRLWASFASTGTPAHIPGSVAALHTMVGQLSGIVGPAADTSRHPAAEALPCAAVAHWLSSASAPEPILAAWRAAAPAQVTDTAMPWSQPDDAVNAAIAAAHSAASLEAMPLDQSAVASAAHAAITAACVHMYAAWHPDRHVLAAAAALDEPWYASGQRAVASALESTRLQARSTDGLQCPLPHAAESVTTVAVAAQHALRLLHDTQCTLRQAEATRAGHSAAAASAASAAPKRRAPPGSGVDDVFASSGEESDDGADATAGGARHSPEQHRAQLQVGAAVNALHVFRALTDLAQDVRSAGMAVHSAATPSTHGSPASSHAGQPGRDTHSLLLSALRAWGTEGAELLQLWEAVQDSCCAGSAVPWPVLARQLQHSVDELEHAVCVFIQRAVCDAVVSPNAVLQDIQAAEAAESTDGLAPIEGASVPSLSAQPCPYASAAADALYAQLAALAPARLAQVLQLDQDAGRALPWRLWAAAAARSVTAAQAPAQDQANSVHAVGKWVAAQFAAVPAVLDAWATIAQHDEDERSSTAELARCIATCLLHLQLECLAAGLDRAWSTAVHGVQQPSFRHAQVQADAQCVVDAVRALGAEPPGVLLRWLDA